MKKLKLALLAATLSMSMTAFGEGADLIERIESLEQRVAALEAKGNETPDGVSEVPAQEVIDIADVETGISVDGCSLEYEKCEVVKDYQDNDCALVYFNFTNGSGETAAAGYKFSVTVYQHNKEVESAIVSGHQAASDIATKLRSGAAPLEVAFARKLEDLSDIIISISAIGHYDLDPVEFTVSLE